VDQDHAAADGTTSAPVSGTIAATATRSSTRPAGERDVTGGPAVDAGVRLLAATAPPAGPGLASLESPAPNNLVAAGSPEQRRRREELTTMRAPIGGASVLRMVLGVLLGVLSVLSLAAGLLLLLLWQQDRSSGVLSTQVDRTWDLVDRIKAIEVIVAYVTVPFAVAWAALVTMNVRRTTGIRRFAATPAAAIPTAVVLVWLIGDRVIAPADDWVGQAVGIVMQALVMLVPLLALEWVAVAAEAHRRPLRVAYLIAIVALVQLQVLGGLSTVAVSLDAAEWGRLGAYLVIGSLLVALGALAANEGGRAIEDAAQHRFNLRRTFGATVTGQASSRG
jgi:hypothetical protein